MKTLKDFADAAGVTIHRCDRQWGGTYGYTTPDAPNCRWNGYRNERELYSKWARETFGEQATRAIVQLLKENSK